MFSSGWVFHFQGWLMMAASKYEVDLNRCMDGDYCHLIPFFND